MPWREKSVLGIFVLCNTLSYCWLQIMSNVGSVSRISLISPASLCGEFYNLKKDSDQYESTMSGMAVLVFYQWQIHKDLAIWADLNSDLCSHDVDKWMNRYKISWVKMIAKPMARDSFHWESILNYSIHPPLQPKCPTISSSAKI